MNPPSTAFAPFRFCYRCGHPNPTARSPSEFLCAGCGFRLFLNPIAAVAVLLTDHEGALLLTRRAQDPGRGKLGLPGGFIDAGETAEQALTREIQEETGLEVTRFEYWASFPNEYPFQGLATPVLDLFYTARVESFAPARALAEVDALLIIPPRQLDLEQVAFRSNARALRRFIERSVRPGS